MLATSRNEYGGSWIPSSSQFLYVTDRSGPQELRLRADAEGTDRRIQIEMMASTGTIVGAPLASPDGQRVAYHSIGSGSSAVWIVPIGGGTPTRLYEEDALQVSPVWSPAGQQIAVWRLGLGLSVVRVGGRSEPIVLSDRAHSEPIAAWSPNGEWIAYQDDDGLQLVSPDGTERRSLTPMLAVGLAWSADSRTIYAQRTRPQDLVAVDVATGRETTLRSFGPDFTYGTPSSPGQRFTLSPDGRSILATVVRVRSDIRILDGFRPPGGLLDWFRR